MNLPVRTFLVSLVLLSRLIFIYVPPVFAATITISNPSITNDEVTVDVSVVALSSSSCPNTRCYLQGMFTQSISNPQYFGYTQNNSFVWYEYSGSPEQDYIKSNFFYFEPQQASWSGQLKVKNNPQDSDYKGPGDYFLRVKRYTGNSSSSTGEPSNDLTIQLAYTFPEPTPSPTPIPTPIPTPPPSPSPSPITIKSPTPTPKSSGKILATGISLVLGETESSLAATTEAVLVAFDATPATSAKETKILPKILLILSGLAILAMVFSAFWLRKKKPI